MGKTGLSSRSPRAGGSYAGRLSVRGPFQPESACPLDDGYIGAPGWNGPGYIVCFVTSFNGTGVNLLTRCFLIIFPAFSTASRPMAFGCCAIVAAMVPALIAASASAMASKPTTNIAFSRLAAAMAWIAPSAISSFCAKTASIFFCACRMFSITVRPLARSKSAVCTATSLIPGEAFRPSRKPFPRSRAADVPAMPSSITTLPFPFNRLATYWAAIFPPATLSDAMWAATVTPFAPRSTVMTGIFPPFTFLMVGAMASLSVGLMAMTATFFWIKSSIWLASRAESFCASSTTRLTFIFLAAAWAPSRRSTKNGLLSVEMDSPTVGGAAAYSGITDSNNSTPTRSNPLRIRSPSPDIFSATHRTKRSVLILSQPPVKEHSQKNDGPLDHLLVERIHIQQVQPVVDDADDESAQQRSTDAAFPAGQRRAAQHHGRDGVQLESDPGGRLRGAHTSGQDDRADGGQDPADHVDQRLVRGDIHTGEPRRLLVAAARIHVAPEDGLREDPIRDQGDQDHDDHRHRDPRHLAGAQPDERIREPGDRTAVSIDNGQAAADGQHAQRSDEGLDLAAGDDQTVEQSQRGAHCQSRPDAHQQRA